MIAVVVVRLGLRDVAHARAAREIPLRLRAAPGQAPARDRLGGAVRGEAAAVRDARRRRVDGGRVDGAAVGGDRGVDRGRGAVARAGGAVGRRRRARVVRSRGRRIGRAACAEGDHGRCDADHGERGTWRLRPLRAE